MAQQINPFFPQNTENFFTQNKDFLFLFATTMKIPSEGKIVFGSVASAWFAVVGYKY